MRGVDGQVTRVVWTATPKTECPAFYFGLACSFTPNYGAGLQEGMWMARMSRWKLPFKWTRGDLAKMRKNRAYGLGIKFELRNTGWRILWGP